MRKSNGNIIVEDEVKSVEYYNMYSSRDFFRGTSFKMAGKWTLNTHYFNDEHIIDFISYNGALLYCLRGHLSSTFNEPKLIYDKDVIIGVEPNPFWAFIMGNSGLGEKGETGDTGPVGPKGEDGITPQLKIENGRWMLSMDDGKTWTDIGQATGDPGTNGTDGINGHDGIGVIAGGTTGQALVKKSNADYDTEWKTISGGGGGDIPNLSAEVVSAQEASTADADVVLENNTFKFSFALPKGADGRDGAPGKDGQDGTVPDYKIYVYKLSDSKPKAPTGTSQTPDGWVDYPDTAGNWWQCIGTVTGTTGLVSVWSEVIPVNGRDGEAQDGKFTEMRFAVNTSNITAPTIDKTKRTPTGWTIDPPTKAPEQFIWMTIATINPNDTLYTEWSTPACISGEQGPQGLPGLDGVQGEQGEQGIPGTPGSDGRTSYFHIKYSNVPNPTTASQMTETPSTYIGTYVDYTQADSTDPSDYTWARFEGFQGEQGIPGTNGEDGKTSYLHIKYSNDGGQTFTGNNGEDVGDWIGIYTDYNINDSNNPADYKWTKIKGERGPQGPAGAPGPAGSNGVSGIPGVSIEIKYCIGTETTYTGTSTLGNVRNPSGWSNTVPTVTEANPYIWFIQSRINYANNDDKVGTVDGTWSTPTILSGINGLDGAPGQPGAPGSKGQIIYPEGIYDVNKVYVCDEKKAPYVYDSGDANYWVLNKVGSWQGTLHSNQTPSTDTSGSWVKLDAFEAIYAKIGIIANGLIGSAVFNDTWMFSQQGVDNQGDQSTNYEIFDPSEPMGGLFTPNIAFDFKTGEGWLAQGKIKFYADGTVVANNITIKNSLKQDYVVYNVDNGVNSIDIEDLYSEISSINSNVFDVNPIFNVNKHNFIIGETYEGAIKNSSARNIKIIYYLEDKVNVGLKNKWISLTVPDASSQVKNDNGYYSTKVVRYVILSPGATMRYNFTVQQNRVGEWVGIMAITNNSDFRYIISSYTGSINTTEAYAAFKGAEYSVPNNIVAVGGVDVQASGFITPNPYYGILTRSGVTLTITQTASDRTNMSAKFTMSGFNLPSEGNYMVVATGTLSPRGSNYSSPLSPFIPCIVNKDDTSFEVWMRFGDGTYTTASASGFSLIIYDISVRA